MDSPRPRDSEVVPVHEIVVPLVIRDLAPGDLPSCAWSGTATHLAAIALALDRARRGEVDYLAACPPSDLPVALGGIDYRKTSGAGTIWQLAVHAALQSCGTGTLLIRAAEHRIRARGLHRAELGGEDGNPRARALYERLGYRAHGCEPDSWDEGAPDGIIARYDTMVTLMRRELPWPQLTTVRWSLRDRVQQCVHRAVVKLRPRGRWVPG